MLRLRNAGIWIRNSHSGQALRNTLILKPDGPRWKKGKSIPRKQCPTPGILGLSQLIVIIIIIIII